MSVLDALECFSRTDASSFSHLIPGAARPCDAPADLAIGAILIPSVHGRGPGLHESAASVRPPPAERSDTVFSKHEGVA